MKIPADLIAIAAHWLILGIVAALLFFATGCQSVTVNILWKSNQCSPSGQINQATDLKTTMPIP